MILVFLQRGFCMLKRTILSVLLGLSFGNVAVAQDKQIPVEAFVEQEQFSIPRLSPDGKHIAVSVRIKRNERNVPTLTIYTLPELKIAATHILPGFEVPVNFEWISNSRLAIQKGEEVGDREPPQPTGEIIAANLDGSQVEYLYGYQNFKKSKRGDRYNNDYSVGLISHIPESRDGNIIVSTHEWRRPRTNLIEINSQSVIRRTLADIPMPGLDFIHQHDGTARFAFGVDEENYAALFRLDDASKDWKRVDSSKLGRGFSPIGFSPDDKALYAQQSENGEPYRLIREDMQTGARTELVKDTLGDIGSIEFSSKPSVPFAVTTQVGAQKARYIDETSVDAKLHKTLSEIFPDAYVHFINFSDDGQKLLFRVASDRDPGAYYIFDKSTGKADMLFANLQSIEPDQMAPRKPVEFKSRDGLTITGYLTMPKHAAGQKLPMVLLPHGGPIGVHDSWGFDPDAQFLASRGYAVLQVNFRGSSGRGVSFRLAGAKQFGGKMIDDLIDGAKWANALPEINPQKVCVYGASYGGYAAMMIPVRDPSLVKCAVGYAGLYDLVGRYSQSGIKGEKQGVNWLKRFMGDDMDKLAAESPVNLADKVKVPVFMAHGTKDETTELGQAERMRKALTQAGNAPEWLLKKNEGHGFYDSEHRKEFYLKLEAFLKKHIGN